MKQLDCDSHALKDSSGNRAKRDMVQFVKFKKFQNKKKSSLAEKVLKEIPDQIIDYFMLKN